MSTLSHQHSPSQRDHGFEQTGTPVGQNKFAADTKPKSTVYFVASDAVDSWSASSNAITAAAHSAKAGDVIRFTSGDMDGSEVHVFDTTTNTIILGEEPTVAISAADTFQIYRYITQVVSSSGTTTSALTFDKDSIPTVVSEDTGTPSNSTPLPVKIFSAAGPINITAGDINVQLTHAGANYDSTRIGDGTNLLGITASNEAKTIDTAAGTKLDSLLTELQLKADLTETQPVSAASLPLPTGAATETTLSTLNGKVTTCNTGAVTISTQLPAGTNNIGDVDVLTLPNVTLNTPSVVDLIDSTGILDTSSTNIPGSGGNPVTVVASLAANVKKVQIYDTTGGFVGVYSGAALSETLMFVYGPGTNETIEHSITSGTRISLKRLDSASALNTGIVAINFIG